jgi:hypothetical protein
VDIKFGIRLLDVLVENCSRILSQGFGVNWAESAFFDVIRLLRQNDELKDYFLLKVQATFALRTPEILTPEILTPNTVPIELIELVAYEFRWPQILELAYVRIDSFFNGNESLAANDIEHRLTRAYEDNWPNKIFYERYQHHSLPSQIITV